MQRQEENGRAVSVPVQFSARGQARRNVMVCSVVPLRLEFAKKDVTGRLLDGRHENWSSTARTTEPTREAWMQEHPLGLVEQREAFGQSGKYGRWIRARQTIVEIDGGLLVHAGLDPALDIRSVREVNDRVTGELAAFDSIWVTLAEAFGGRPTALAIVDAHFTAWHAGGNPEPLPAPPER